MADLDPMNEDGKLIAAGGWCAPNDSVYETFAACESLPSPMIPRSLNSEEHERRKAERMTRAEIKLREYLEWYLSVVEKVSSVPHDSAREALLALLRRHIPRNAYGVIECSGVHDTGWEMEPGEWPCKDFLVIAGVLPHE